MRMRHLVSVVLLATVANANLQRHNEQGLSPTHSYKSTSPNEAISNLNGNLVIRSVAADVTSTPLPMRVERTFNSHWRDPLFAFQFDLDYDNANGKNDDGDDDIRFKNIWLGDPSPTMRVNDVIGGVLARENYSFANLTALPKGFAWTVGIATSLVGVPTRITQRVFDKAGMLGNNDNLNAAGEAFRWTGVAFAAVGLALEGVSVYQNWDNFSTGAGWRDHWDDNLYEIAAIGTSAMNLAYLLAPQTLGSFGTYVPFIGLAIQIWGAYRYFDKANPWDPGYDAQSLAIPFSLIGSIIAIPFPWVLAVVAVIQVSALIYTLWEMTDMTWDIGDQHVRPWSYGVNNYVGMFGHKSKALLSSGNGPFGDHRGGCTPPPPRHETTTSLRCARCHHRAAHGRTLPCPFRWRCRPLRVE